MSIIKLSYVAYAPSTQASISHLLETIFSRVFGTESHSEHAGLLVNV